MTLLQSSRANWLHMTTVWKIRHTFTPQLVTADVAVLHLKRFSLNHIHLGINTRQVEKSVYYQTCHASILGIIHYLE
jgi:hypothetical protein